MNQQCNMPVQPDDYQKPEVSYGAPKSKLVAGLLAIFLGTYGIHNFYLGYTKRALIQLLVSVLSCFTLAVVSGIWGLIEGIQILCGTIVSDAKGVPLKD